MKIKVARLPISGAISFKNVACRFQISRFSANAMISHKNINDVRQFCAMDQAPPSEVHKEQALEEIQSKVECLPSYIQQLVNSAIQQVKSIERLVMLMQAVKTGSFGVDVVRAATGFAKLHYV